MRRYYWWSMSLSSPRVVSFAWGAGGGSRSGPVFRLCNTSHILRLPGERILLEVRRERGYVSWTLRRTRTETGALSDVQPSGGRGGYPDGTTKRPARLAILLSLV